MVGGPALSQEISDAPTPETPIFEQNGFFSSGWSDDLIGPPYIEDPGQVITTTVIQPVERPPQVAVHSDINQQVPVLQTYGEYFDPSGLCSLGPMSEESNQMIRSQMKKTVDMGFRCFLLRVDWLAVKPDANRVDAVRVQELLQYGDDIGLKVIISLEFRYAPDWFFRGEGGSDRVMVSRLVDPEREQASGNDGDLRWTDGTGIPNFCHPDTLRAIENLIYSLCNTIKDEPALLGWYLSGPVTFGFPGGGRDSVVGICDYSPFSVNRFSETTGARLMAYPLPRYSQGSWDQRIDFWNFRNIRLNWKRNAFETVVSALREVDKEHLLLVGMDPVLNYRSDNGYLSMVQAPDAIEQLLNRDVNGAIINFKLSSESFDALNDRSECSAMHLALTINQVVRNNRLAIVLIESDRNKPPELDDIMHLAYMIKAAGAYPVWSSGFLNRRGRQWSWTEENTIERMQPLSLLPPPKRLRRGCVGILDIPEFYSSFYAESNGSVSLSLIQLAIHQRTGVVLEVVSVDELIGPDPVLQQYSNLIYLVPDLLTSDEAKSWFNPAMQVALYGYSKGSGGIIEAVDPMLLHQYVLEDFHSLNLEDQLRTRYMHRGATADLLHGADAFIVANDPYIFIRVDRLNGARYIDVKLTGWPESNLDMVSVIDLPSGNHRRVEMTSGSASFPFRPSYDSAHLFVLTDDYAPVARSYEIRKTGVAIAQQARHMRRSVPAALLLAALLAVTLIWMTFQCQQRSLIQAAELVDRRRQMEPIDILDEPEVMEFYRTYISDDEGGQSGELKK